jgi:hypothetical protein
MTPLEELRALIKQHPVDEPVHQYRDLSSEIRQNIVNNLRLEEEQHGDKIPKAMVRGLFDTYALVVKRTTGVVQERGF